MEKRIGEVLELFECQKRQCNYKYQNNEYGLSAFFFFGHQKTKKPAYEGHPDKNRKSDY